VGGAAFWCIESIASWITGPFENDLIEVRQSNSISAMGWDTKGFITTGISLESNPSHANFARPLQVQDIQFKVTQ